MKKFNSSLVISFMGTDGSGKSTLIKKLTKRLKKNYRKIKYLHLRPYLFLTDSSVVNTNPHDQKLPLSQVGSLIKILTWLWMYYFFFLINLYKKNQLIIFDRYAHDLLIDKIRYRFNLPKKFTQFILNLFPKPNLWIVLKAPIKLIEKRKKELSINELKRQMNEYINFSKKQKNTLLVDTEKKIEKNILLIARKMKSIIS
tara:strand:+ start:1079 stop:1678 length:600 start_codon:yes stop_codon:yes gene_type:complete